MNQFDVDAVKQDQCEYKQYDDWFFAVDNYICRCADSYYLDNEDNGYPAPYMHAQLQLVSGDSQPRFRCRACPLGCGRCGVDRTCRAQLDLTSLRAIPLAIQSFCITICFLLGITVFRLRRTRVIKAANWILLEILLLGAVLLYFIVVVMYFPASDITCLTIPWLRELGFSIMYGVLIVKIYRVLSAFQSRKAHRVHVRDKDILKFLGIFITTTFTYMVAWTAVNLDYISSTPWNWHPDGVETHVSMILQGQTSAPRFVNVSFQTNNYSDLTTKVASTSTGLDTVTFDVCRAMSWDIVVELAEFIILAVSIHYCRLVRTAPSEYNETRYISIALIIELTGSGILNVVRHLIWYSVHPDYVFLLYFARSHITVTVNMILIFGPKAWSVYRPSSTTAGASRTRTTPAAPYSADPNLASSGKLNLTLNGDLDIADVNLADMDPEVIRRELKRLYTQIEMYKTKAMRKDNPHISKRRGGRKQRRFSLQPFHKRHQGQPVPGNVPLMIPTESGYCWADCRSSRGGGSGIGGSGTCPKHGVKHTESCTLGNPTCGTPGSRAGSYYAYSGIVHDEEVSKLSEESTNSVEEFTPPSNAQQPQHHQLLSTTASGQQAKRRLPPPKTMRPQHLQRDNRWNMPTTK
ncbi:hypothetical protein EG68_06249 [Paragonimus skrjabini miyazakii]|uniref:G-protein coupled receptors family 3 profile domain-containing protein n=1 Tax=Paragonimus skrjabini miyazakii TaxID=59628 RepID=A0A8S9YVJ6_9TREM|nr:hypothetical protein EG68_06249 [Paragonimus skrjabini miyazakii]